MTSRRTMYVDAATRPGRAIAVAVVTEHAAADAVPDSRDWPLDVRHANPEAIVALLRELPIEPVLAVWVAEPDAEERSLAELVVDLVAWLAICARSDADEPDQLVVAQLAASVDDAPSARLPGPDELAVALARTARWSIAIGWPPRPAPTVVQVPYGVPSTPTALVRARLTATAILRGVDLPAEPRRSVAPDAPALRELERLAMLATQQPASPLAVARSARAVGAGDGDGGAWLSDLRGLVLGRLVERASAPDARSATAAMLRATIGEIAGIVDARQGDYEACDEVLARFVDPRGGGEASLAELALDGDPWALASAWLVRARVANHRGDAGTATRACQKAVRAARREASVRARVLALEATNLTVVAAQNLWPYVTGTPSFQALHDAAVELEREVGRYQALVTALGEAPAPASREPRLTIGAIAEPAADQCDPILGAAYGTLGRSMAFLGRHDDAVSMLLFARAHLLSPLDRSLNTCFLLHVELDRPRPDPAIVGQLFDRVVAVDERAPSAFARRLAAGDLGSRFTVDLLLKAMVAGIAVPGATPREWADALSDEQGLLASLARVRTHPTELIARHAGELLHAADRRERSAAWLTLGIEVGREGGGALQRIARFTELLAGTAAAPAGAPRGSIFNPCYEYR